MESEHGTRYGRTLTDSEVAAGTEAYPKVFIPPSKIPLVRVLQVAKAFGAQQGMVRPKQRPVLEALHLTTPLESCLPYRPATVWARIFLSIKRLRNENFLGRPP